MIATLYFFVLAICFVCVFFNNQSRIVALIGTVAAFIIFAGNNSNSDYNLYLFSLMTDDYDRYEKGYQWYYNLYKSIGITDYQTTVIITFCLLGIIIYFTMKKITKNYCMVIFFLIIAELFIETVQIRMMIASVFIFVAVYMYSVNKRKIALLFSVFSCLFQMSGAFFIPFFIAGMVKREKKQISEKSKYQFIIGFFAVYLILLLCNNLLNINLPLLVISTVGKRFSILKQASFYFGGTSWGSVQFVVLYFVNLLSVCFIKHNTPEDSVFGEAVENINMYAALSLPFLFVDMNFYRFFRILNLSNFVFFASAFEFRKRNVLTVKNFQMLAVLCASQICWVVSYVLRVPEIYTDIFSNNIWS